MPENEINFEDDKKHLLQPNEKIVWEGKPKKTAFVLEKVMVMIPLSLIWLFFDSCFITTYVVNGVTFEEFEMEMFFRIFFMFHTLLVVIWLSSIYSAKRNWKNTKYYITDERVIIRFHTEHIIENYQEVYFRNIKSVRLHEGIIDKMLGLKDIYFDLTYYKIPTSAKFLYMDDYENVYQRVQKVVLDIQTDIEYPNALRPDSNPGHNTKYNPIDGE